MKKHFIIATAGHVDHGKSSLVKALTGTDPDRLPEEKARGMTIDLGFAGLNLGDFHLGIVDVPGHDAFVRNMIAGVGSIDLALFVVAADDGWMPQTEEHLQILSYLGVSRAVVALTKIDIGDAEKVEREIREQLCGTLFSHAPIVCTSTHLTALSSQVGEDGIEKLKRVLALELEQIQPPRNIGKPRLFVDRAFQLRGIGTVVTGTLVGGTLRTGENVLVQPGQVSARIRSLQSHGHDVDLAQPGMRTAINLPELQLETDIQRGHVLTTAGFETTAAFGVVLEKSPRSGEHALKNRTQVYLHYGTGRIRAKVVFFNKDALRRGERAVAQLRLDSPIVAFLGDRFVLRDPSEQSTIAGGVVLDLEGGRDADLLRERAVAPDDADLCVRTEITRRRAVPISSLLLPSHFAADEIVASVKRLDILMRNELAIDRQHWSLLRERAVNLIDRVHRQSSDRSGLELSELRAALRDEPPALLDALIADLCVHDFVRARSTIARSSHQPALPLELRAIAQKLLQEISARPFDPPARKRIAPDSKSQQALRFLIENGEIVELAPDTIVAAESFARMKDAVIAFISKNGRATVSDLRQALQTSRRIMVPFLERLDRDRVTRRFGDERKLADEVVSHSALK